jgi:hypothetical protein
MCPTAQVLAGNGFVARDEWAGIYATAASRMARDVRGQTLQVRFTILDKRPPLALPANSKWNATRGPYNVFVTLQVHIHITILVFWDFQSKDRVCVCVSRPPCESKTSRVGGTMCFSCHASLPHALCPNPYLCLSLFCALHMSEGMCLA